MAAPKQRHTKSRRDRRRSHLKLKDKKVSLCPKCNSPILPHRMCSNCGTYAGREVIDVLAKLDKKERKRKEKEMADKKSNESVEGKNLSIEGLSKK
ncbi:50S ribosomal protein L32 [Patescibacteria group bacterium]